MESDTFDSFIALSPERILTAVEALGVRCTGRCLQLNSMENRVFEVEIEVSADESTGNPRERFRVVKFYRPGRWSQAQILEEHRYLTELSGAEVPVVAPCQFRDGTTLHQEPTSKIWYTVFPKQGGRNPGEITEEFAPQIGRALARMHAIGSGSDAPNRLRLTPDEYGRSNLQFLLAQKLIHPKVEAIYAKAVEQLCTIIEPLFRDLRLQRIHGDCHMGNLLWADGPWFVDFDDMVVGPCVQDFWLLLSGRDDYAKEQLRRILDSYQQLRPFDWSTLRLIEPLRALRYIHYSAWIARRWQDPTFPRAFPEFGTEQYWNGAARDLFEQLNFIGDSALWSIS